MPRLFIAIDLPERAVEALHEIAFGFPDVSWVPPEQYHLTLRFLGETPNTLFENVMHGLHEVRSESFYFDLKGVGHFPLRGRPETLWAGVAQSEPLVRLRNRIESALSRAGVPAESRKFHPHVSLGRLKNPPTAEMQTGGFEIQNSLFSLYEIPAEEFHLYSSRLSSQGAEHTIEATYPLDGILEGESSEGLAA